MEYVSSNSKRHWRSKLHIDVWNFKIRQHRKEMKSNFLVLSAEAKCLDVKNGLKQTYWNGWFLALSTYQRKRDWNLSSFLVYKNDIALDSLVIILLATYDLNIFNNIQGIYVAVDLIFECDKCLQKERDLEKSLLPLVSVNYKNEDIS